MQDATLNGKCVAASNDCLWHGNMDHRAWVAAQGMHFPSICAEPSSSTSNFADLLQDGIIKEGFAEAVRHPQITGHDCDPGTSTLLFGSCKDDRPYI